MFKRTALVVCALLAATSCNGGAENTTPDPSPIATDVQGSGESFAPGKVLIDTESGSVLIDVELAENEAQRVRGLMFRESLDENAGMLFVFEEENDAGS